MGAGLHSLRQSLGLVPLPLGSLSALRGMRLVQFGVFWLLFCPMGKVCPQYSGIQRCRTPLAQYNRLQIQLGFQKAKIIHTLNK